MFLGVIFLACVVSVPLTGGRLSRLADVRFRRPGLIVASIVLQVLIISILPGGNGPLHQAVHLFTYGLAGAFVVVNRRIPGLVIAAAGGAMNFAAIAANGGVMPAEPRALDIAGIAQHAGSFENSTAVAHPKLQFLGDIFAVPGVNVFSAGDIVLVAGILVGLHAICRRRPFALRSFEAVPATDTVALLRVTGSDPDEVVALHVDADGCARRLTPLPSSAPCGDALGFGVPAQVLGRRPYFSLELSGGERVALPPPARRRLVHASKRSCG